MDASTLAALAVAIQESHAAAIRALLLDRERVAMSNEDARSRLAADAQRQQDMLRARRATRAAQRARQDEDSSASSASAGRGASSRWRREAAGPA